MQNVLCILQNREGVDNCIMRLNIYSTEIFWLIFVSRENEKPSCFTLCFDLLPKPQLAELNAICNILKQYVISYSRSSHRRCSVRKGVLRNFAKLTGKHLCQRLLFNKVAGLTTLFKMRLCHKCFPVDFAKFLRTPFLQNTYGRLLLLLQRAIENLLSFSTRLIQY